MISMTEEPIRPIAKQMLRLTEFKISRRALRKTSMMKMMMMRQITLATTTREVGSLPNPQSTTSNLSKKSRVGKRNLRLIRR